MDEHGIWLTSMACNLISMEYGLVSMEDILVSEETDGILLVSIE